MGIAFPKIKIWLWVFWITYIRATERLRWTVLGHYGSSNVVELVRNVMAHAQKPHFVFRLNGRVYLNRWGSQFSRLLAAEVCASAWVMLDRPRSEVAWEYWLPTPFASFPFTSPPVRHRVPPGSEWALPPQNSHNRFHLHQFDSLFAYHLNVTLCSLSHTITGMNKMQLLPLRPAVK